jgi:hypothetical protein
MSSFVSANPLLLTRAIVFPTFARRAVPRNHYKENAMLISKDDSGKTIGWRETYISKDESVDVSVHRSVTSVTTRDRNTGKVQVKTFFGKTPLTSDEKK